MPQFQYKQQQFQQNAVNTIGVNITRPPGPMKYGTQGLAFIEDPDGYKVELNEPLESF